MDKELKLKLQKTSTISSLRQFQICVICCLDKTTKIINRADGVYLKVYDWDDGDEDKLRNAGLLE